MATSGSITALDTASDIITDALRELQILSANRSAKASDMELGRRRLLWMLKEWQDDGCNLWRQAEADISWPAATAVGDLSPDINDITTLDLVTGTDTTRPLTRWEIGQYNDLPNKAVAGSPTIYCITQGLTGARLRLWPVPAGIVSLIASYTRVIEDVAAISDNLDVPQKYTRTVMMNLAAALVPAFGRANAPESVIVLREAARLYQLMRAADRPASYFMSSSRYAR